MGWWGFPTFLKGTVTRHKGRTLVVKHTRANPDFATLHLGSLEHRLRPKGCVVRDSLRVLIAGGESGFEYIPDLRWDS